ncbi:ArgR family transcriptional regulator, partial [Terriglobus sp. YAF25]
AEDDRSPEINDLSKSFGLEVRQAMNQVVIITTTGGAQPVAAGLDYEDWDEIVGTIAGDDTVLVICGDIEQAKTITARIAELIR